jgi:hypothetical protein
VVADGHEQGTDDRRWSPVPTRGAASFEVGGYVVQRLKGIIGEIRWLAHHKKSPLVIFTLVGSLDDITIELQKRSKAGA